MGAVAEPTSSGVLMPTLRRLAVLLILVAIPWTASAANPRSERNSKPAKAAPARSFLDHAWAFLVGAWTKEGCGIDPSGRCALATVPTDQADIGCGVDPNGRCGL